MAGLSSNSLEKKASLFFLSLLIFSFQKYNFTCKINKIRHKTFSSDFEGTILHPSQLYVIPILNVFYSPDYVIFYLTRKRCPLSRFWQPIGYIFEAQADFSSLKPETAQPKWKVFMGFAIIILIMQMGTA